MPYENLYDIRNYEDLKNGIDYMEAQFNESYDLIFMEMPNIKEFPHMYVTTADSHSQRQVKNIETSFLKKCIENAYRLLNDTGILVFVAPKTNYSNQDYFLPLSQLFPSIIDMIVHYSASFDIFCESYFFCSKQPQFAFPIIGSQKPEREFPHSDKDGKYRLSPLIRQKHPYASLGDDYGNFEWHGMRPHKNEVWRCSADKLNDLFEQERIVIKGRMVFQKIYRIDSMTPNNAPLWEKNTKKTHSLYHCDSELLSLIFSLYCKNDSYVFCPFDYDGIFPKVANQMNLNWTSIKTPPPWSHPHYWEIPDSKHRIHLDFTKKLTRRDYKEKILTNPTEINTIKGENTVLKKPWINIHVSKESMSCSNLPQFDSQETAKQFKYIRKNVCHLTLDDVVSLFDGEISRQSIINWESGKYFPSPENLIKLAAIYGVHNLNDFFKYTLEEPPQTTDKEN